jgi:hypothetical protein
LLLLLLLAFARVLIAFRSRLSLFSHFEILSASLKQLQFLSVCPELCCNSTNHFGYCWVQPDKFQLTRQFFRLFFVFVI